VSRRRVGVIVDPFSSGILLAPELRAVGFSPVALLSAKEPPPDFRKTYRPQDFDEIIIGDGPIDEVVAKVAALEPEFVVSATETGVELGDAVAPRVTPHVANVPELAAARRHKGAMGEAVRAAGLRVARQVCTDDPAEVAAWIEREGLEGQPLVLKPPKSGGTDGVVRIRPGDDWRPAFDRLLGSRNRLTLLNDKVLVMELLVGTEFVVDTYSVDGRHFVTDVCRYRKVVNEDHIAVYDSMEFIDDDPTPGRSLVEYSFQVLDALGIRNGAAHTEVMLTEDGPVHIETGSRLHGGGHPEYCRLATGDSQLDRMIAHLTGARPVNGDYHLEQTVLVVFLIAHETGIVTNIEVFEQAAKLPTHYKSAVPVHNGDRIEPTRDLFTALGFVVLAGERRDDVFRDYDAIKEIERSVRVEATDELAAAR
jgi:biotin carboxylase